MTQGQAFDDMVNHPPHYNNHPSGVECIEVARHMGYDLGNAFKYLFRHGSKGGLEDLQKAIWYINDELTQGLLPGGWVSSKECLQLMGVVDRISSFEPMPIRIAMRNVAAYAFSVNAVPVALEQAIDQIKTWIDYKERNP